MFILYEVPAFKNQIENYIWNITDKKDSQYSSHHLGDFLLTSGSQTSPFIINMFLICQSSNHTIGHKCNSNKHIEVNRADSVTDWSNNN